MSYQLVDIKEPMLDLNCPKCNSENAKIISLAGFFIAQIFGKTIRKSYLKHKHFNEATLVLKCKDCGEKFYRDSREAKHEELIDTPATIQVTRAKHISGSIVDYNILLNGLPILNIPIGNGETEAIETYTKRNVIALIAPTGLVLKHQEVFNINPGETKEVICH